MENLEEKTFKFDLKALTEEGTFEGHAAIFNIKDQLDPPEIIEPRSFKKTLKENSAFPITWCHDVRTVLGISYPEEDETGLKVKGELNKEVQAAREKYALMKQKAIRGLSIGFKTIKDRWENGIRIISEIKLYEIALVTFPAHPQALISSVKQIDVAKETPPKGFKNISEFYAETKEVEYYDE